MAYIGRQLVRGQNRILDDISSSFNGSTTAFNLTVSSSSSPPASVNQLWIILGGVLQKPGTDFTVADAVITFTTAPASTLNFWGMIQGDTSDINSPADASVTPSKIANRGDFAFPADVRFNDADGSHYVGLQAPSTVSSNLVWTLPATDGSANQLLKTDGSGALGSASDTQSNLLDEDNMSSNSATQPASQQSIKASADTKAVLTGSTDNTICTVTGANALQGESALTFDGNDLQVRTTKANLIVAKSGLTVKANSDIHTTYDLLQIGAGGVLASYSTATATASTHVLHNAYRHSTGAWNRRYADTACKIEMNSPGGEIEFFTAGTDAAESSITWTPTVQVKANGNLNISDGDLVIGTSGHGIDFGAHGNTAGSTYEKLYDYEEGTFTPTMAGSTTAGSMT